MLIKIDKEKCAGHGRCAAVAPSIYALDDSGYITSETIHAPDVLAKDAIRGMRACPERIISIDDVVTVEGSTSQGSIGSGSSK